MLSEPFALPLEPELKNQVLPAAELLLGFRYLSEPGRWFVTAVDADTGADITPSVPLIASYGARNDLFRPFRYKLNYSLVCVPLAAAPSSPDPGRDNLSEFSVILMPE